MASWQIGEAKERFSELLHEAHEHGAQFITENGIASAVLLPIEEYSWLRRREPTFVEFLLTGPKTDDFEIERDEDRRQNLSVSGDFK